MIAKEEKILLILMPYWTPQIPPLGISSLKSYLNQSGYANVNLLDLNIEQKFKDLLNEYFEVLAEEITEEYRSNFLSLSNYVLKDNLIAHYLHTNRADYADLIKEMVYNYYFTRISDGVVIRLIEVLDRLTEAYRARVTEILTTEKPKVLGFSIYSGTVMNSIIAAEMAKAYDPGILTIVGGGAFSDSLSKSSPDYEHFLKYTEHSIDKVILGEGELLLVNLLEGKLDPNQRVFSIEDLKREVIDLDAPLIPDYTQLMVDNYPHLTTYTSRSCPYQCYFCSETVYGGRYRKKTAAFIVEELSHLYKKHRYQLFLFGDSLLNPIIDKLSDQMLQSNVKFYWDGYLRADKPVCDPANTMKWRKGGFYRARLGVESGSDRVLKLMNKKITAQQIKDAVSSLASAGIKTTTYWIVGYPGETEEDFQDTLSLIREIKDDLYQVDCNPFMFEISGMVNSENWSAENKVSKLYDEERFRHMVLLNTWKLECYPGREVIFDRLRRFVKFYQDLGIPNPYSIEDIFEADERWKRLHKNAVPSVIELLEYRNTDGYFEEAGPKGELTHAVNYLPENNDWSF